MPDLPTATIVAAALVVALAYTVFGITGFGATIVGVPLLAHMLPIRFVVPMMLVFDLTAGLLLGLRNRRDVDRGELLRLAPFIAVGMAVGVVALVRAPERWLLAVLGVFVFSYACWSLARRAAPRPISRRLGGSGRRDAEASSPRSTAAAGRSTPSISPAASATRNGCARASPSSSSAPRGRAWPCSRRAA